MCETLAFFTPNLQLCDFGFYGAVLELASKKVLRRAAEKKAAAKRRTGIRKEEKDGRNRNASGRKTVPGQNQHKQRTYPQKTSGEEKNGICPERHLFNSTDNFNTEQNSTGHINIDRINTEKLEALLKKAGKLFAGRNAAAHTREKGVADYVTEVDFAVQQFIRGHLEELDPVDGTTNLIHDYRASVISLALMQKGSVVLGMIYNPYADELFSAQKGEGSYCNG